MTAYKNFDFHFGNRRLVGQPFAREQFKRILKSGRVSHAYLLSGSPGIGKKAFALAFAELINGIDNLTELGKQAFSKKSSWFTHPDIRVFLPVPSSAVRKNQVETELRPRLEMLREDPYEIVDFSLRPSLTDNTSAKNLQAFYPIDYFRDYIRKSARLTPNEGRKTVIVLTDIEHMRKETANAFLKLLEEPSDDLMFILTTSYAEALLPTILSRCQHIQLSALKTREIEQALISYEGLSGDDAGYLARVSGGNYAMTRFFDVAQLKSLREEVVDFLRASYIQDAVTIANMAKDWQDRENIEGQIAILNVLEVFLRDLLVYRATENDTLITNAGQLDVIQKFCDTLGDARLQSMIEEVSKCRPMIYQYVQGKIVFTTLSLRFFSLMRDRDTEIPAGQAYKHLPALSE